MSEEYILIHASYFAFINTGWHLTNTVELREVGVSLSSLERVRIVLCIV